MLSSERWMVIDRSAAPPLMKRAATAPFSMGLAQSCAHHTTPPVYPSSFSVCQTLDEYRHRVCAYAVAYSVVLPIKTGG